VTITLCHAELVSASHGINRLEIPKQVRDDMHGVFQQADNSRHCPTRSGNPERRMDSPVKPENDRHTEGFIYTTILI